jgi:hybrid cluster-associated redox disulfide protein
MIKKKIKQKITKNTLILEIAERYPELINILTNKYQFHCIGCSMSAIETLGEGAMVHGMDKEMIKKMVDELNQKLVKKVKTEGKKRVKKTSEKTRED